jgi:hypothetical protein
MATLATDGTVLSVQEYALADVHIHVRLGCLGALAGAVAEGALRVGELDNTLSRTDRAVLCLHHTRYRELGHIYSYQ